MYRFYASLSVSLLLSFSRGLTRGGKGGHESSQAEPTEPEMEGGSERKGKLVAVSEGRESSLERENEREETSEATEEKNHRKLTLALVR